MDVRMTPLERLRRLIAPAGGQKRQGKQGEFEEALSKEGLEDPSAEGADPGEESEADRHPLFDHPGQDSETRKKNSCQGSVDGKGLKVNLLA